MSPVRHVRDWWSSPRETIVTQSLMVTWRRTRTNSKKKQKICRDKLSWSIRNLPLVFWLHAYWRRRLRLKSAILRVSNLRDLDLTLNRVMRHTVVYHSSTFTYTIFHSNRKIFCGRTDRRTLLRLPGSWFTQWLLWCINYAKLFCDDACNGRWWCTLWLTDWQLLAPPTGIIAEMRRPCPHPPMTANWPSL